MLRLSRRLRSQRSHELESLPASQVGALVTLERHGTLALHELARYEKVRPPSMNRIVGQLEERGLVEREPHPTDRRQVLFAPTDEGRALIKEDRRRRDAWLAQRLRELTPGERETLRAAAPVLEKLANS
ncbi:MAG TPA: MarR family transcriptional regulator [Streptosporangiales bacterium]